MKILLAIIITATFSFGCAMLEGEQTTTDTAGGGTTSAPTGGGDSTPTVAADSAVTSGRIAAGENYTCAIKADDSVQCWGRNDMGQTDVLEGVYRQISVGVLNTCALDDSGAMICWGNEEKLLGK